jgi:hypothetical protein
MAPSRSETSARACPGSLFDRECNRKASHLPPQSTAACNCVMRSMMGSRCSQGSSFATGATRFVRALHTPSGSRAKRHSPHFSHGKARPLFRKSARTEARFSQRAFCELAGLCQFYLNSLEAGHGNAGPCLSLKSQVLVAAALMRSGMLAVHLCLQFLLLHFACKLRAF